MPLPGQTVRFGPFQLDLRTAELHCNGTTIKLPEHPFQVLCELVEHPGEVVTREELRQRLWHSDTFVDFEHGLNAAVKRLRELLDDSAEKPIYIETLPRRGYRLMVAVEKPEPVPTASNTAVRRWKIWLVAAVAGVVVVALAAGLWWWQHLHRVYALTPSDRIVIADFTNSTGDAVFDDTLKQGLTMQLEQSPFLNIVSQTKVQETLRLMEHPADERVTAEMGRELCQRVGAKALLTGSIASLGSQYVIGLTATECGTGNLMAIEQTQAANKEGVLKALDAAAVSVRSKLGESLSTVQKYATPLEEATTPSLEALKAYSLGVKTGNEKGMQVALSFYKRAVEIDPNFAMAYAAMGLLYIDLNEPRRGAGYLRKAYGLPEKVSERERFNIEALYYHFVTGELGRAAQTCELWLQAYPRDPMPYRQLGIISYNMGNSEKYLEASRAVLRLEPDSGSSYVNLGNAYVDLNRLEEAEAVYKQAEERKLENEELVGNRYGLAFLKGDVALMEQLVSAAMGKPGTEDLLLAEQADTEAWYGKLKDAHELTQKAMDSAQHNDAREGAAGYQAEEALRDVESGNQEQARAEVNASVKLAPNRDVQAIAALVLARAGDTVRAEKLAAELDKTFSQQTWVQRYWLPTIRAAIALERKDPNRAIEALKVTGTVELGQQTNLNVWLCPVYLRGEAYLMLRDDSRAAAEFQKFIDHRGLVGNFPWGALARLGLARAYAMSGDTAKAKAAYQDFLTLWNDADPDIPILKQAKAEYAKLQ